ncbi:Zn-ribbon domain-containing OB-fold protein [Polaromonas glacialis]|uniref:Zn-ribbon domain-containing OB-fold protein n=1 Tax=Polaromonas glacialis TaxID=866564 RepID=UPI000A06EA53|nr:Zn-ribbon domain-containing OB-fold protein [Polaromonas glacialis]
MAYLPAGMPAPQATREDAPFWTACNEQRLVIRHCNACHRFFHPPMPACPRCASTDVGWQEVSGTGTVFTYTVGYHATHSALKGHPPYNVAVVLLDGADDVRLVSNVVDVAPQDMKIGMPVTVFWDEISEGVNLPRFKKRLVQGSGAKDAA